MDNKVTVDEALEAVKSWQRQDATLAFVDLHTCRAITGVLAAELERLRADAERYQYLKSLLLGANFAHDQTKNPVLEFELPEGARVSANLDKTIDAARGE